MESFIPYEVNKLCREGGEDLDYSQDLAIFSYGPFAAALSCILEKEDKRKPLCCGKSEKDELILYRGIRITDDVYQRNYKKSENKSTTNLCGFMSTSIEIEETMKFALDDT